MKTTRFWALWAIGLIFALAMLIQVVAPQGLYVPELANVTTK